MPDIQNDLVSYGAQVNTIAFGREGDVQLEELSRVTGGRSYFTDPKAPNSIIQDAFIAELQKDEDHAYPIVSLKKPIGICCKFKYPPEWNTSLILTLVPKYLFLQDATPPDIRISWPPKGARLEKGPKQIVGSV